MEEDKKKSVDKKVRVRHLVETPLAEIYPKWADKEADCDKKLDNMIRDILDGCLDESFWETDDGERKKSKSKVVESAEGAATKRKRKVVESADGAATKRKSKVLESDDDFIEDYRAPKSSKKQSAQAEEEKRRKKKATLNKGRSDESTETSMSADDDTSLREEVNRQKKAMRKAKERENEERSRHYDLTAMLQVVLDKVNAIDDRVSAIEALREGGPTAPVTDVNSNAEGGGAQPKPVEQGSPDPVRRARFSGSF
uniref:Uncharacterized protein n=1 Tax=Noccaea caerulescens TaxID=107243 RepID=A0A1J3CM10_NOCCA